MANESMGSDDHFMALEMSIIESLREKDSLHYKIDPSYLVKLQPSIKWNMRVMLVDWMMEVCDEFGLYRETFHLAATFVDLYLSRKECPIDRLQLLGAAGMMLACKMEEISK